MQAQRNWDTMQVIFRIVIILAHCLMTGEKPPKKGPKEAQIGMFS